METRKEGWLHKNHAGEPFAKDSQRRWFETVGFTVCYFRLPDKKSLKGHFDLRNVISIAPISDAEDIKAAGADAVAFSVSEEGKAPKTMILAFKVEGSADREGWLKLWCSAITADAVDAKLKQYIDPELSKLLNDKFANQEAVSRQRSLFGSKVSYTKVLTPRQSSDAIAQHQTGGSSALDTPRGDQLPAPAPLPPPAKEDDVPTTFEITVPDGVKPGDRLQATTPSGTKVKLVVPEGAEPGMLLTFQVPKGAGKKKKPKPDVDPAQEKSAIAIQKRLRGMNTRKQVRPTPPPVAKPEMVDNAAADQELSKAAMKLQAHYRGLATRNEQQESARLQWLQYYVETEEWEQALGLAVTPDEEAVIEKARKMAKPPASEEELRRQKWLKYYLNNGKFDKAAEIITSPLESAMFIKAKALRATRCFACLPRAEIEKERQERFIAAVRGYVWDQAEVLALTAEEMQDVHDSKVRVAHFEQALEDHKLDEAQQLAITDAEEARVAKAIAAQGGTANGHHHVSEMQISIPVSKETQAAALKVQAIVRGHQARDHQEEARRVEWLRYFAAEGQLDEALKLCIQPAETTAIKRLQVGDKGGLAALDAVTAASLLPKPAPSPAPKPASKAAPAPTASPPTPPKPIPAPPAATSAQFIEAVKAYDWEAAAKLAKTEEDQQDLASSKARVLWLAEYIRLGEADKAKGLAITQAEVKRVEWVLEGKTFADAVKKHEWDVAMQLASTPQEKLDVQDSQARVMWLEKHLAAGEYDQAKEMAITEAELLKIDQMKLAAGKQ